LTTKYTQLCYKDNNIRTKLFSTVVDPRKQIFFNASNYYRVASENCDIVDVSVFSEVHGLNALRCDRIVEVNCLKNLHYLDLPHCTNINDVSCLGKVSLS
jgi:hypothetical protein